MFAKTKLLLIAAVVATGAASTAHAQFFKLGPGFSLGLNNGNGTYTYIHPWRLLPGASQPLPGTYTQGPAGQYWIGQDGLPHSNFVDPWGNYHMTSAPPSSGQGGDVNDQGGYPGVQPGQPVYQSEPPQMLQPKPRFRQRRMFGGRRGFRH